ncbi:MAG: hypothetical protein JXM70_04625 [Pirellulales bacterium]|nr:hypothetical protein [Pirellulales bacterium]
MTTTSRHRFKIAVLVCIVLAAACVSSLAGVFTEVQDAATRIKNSQNVSATVTGAKDTPGYPRQPFRAPSGDELEAARLAVEDSLTKLFTELEEIPVGASIKRELALDKLAEQLASSRPDIAVLSSILDGLSGIVYQPGIPKFEGLNDRLTRYIALCRLTYNKELRTIYKQQLAKLDTALAAPARARSHAELQQITEVYAWLTTYFQAPQTRSWLEERFARPNFVAVMSPNVLAGQFEQELRRDIEINETRQGITTTGRSTAIGNMKFELVPNRDIGQLRVVFNGDANCKLKSRRKRVCINGQMRAKLSASQDVFAARTLSSAKVPDVDVSCDYRPCNAAVCARSEMIRRVGSRLALRIAQRKKHEVDRMGARFIEQSLAKEIAKIAGEELEQMNRTMDEFVFIPLRSDGIEPEIVTRTSKTRFEIMGTFFRAGQLAAPQQCPPVDPKYACSAWFHESMINNLAVLLEGEELEEHLVRETLFESLGLLPEEPVENDPSWISTTVRFARRDPFSVRFIKDKIRLRVRLDAFSNELGWQDGGPWEAHTAYTVDTTGKYVILRRCEPIELNPTGSPIDRQMQEILSRVLVKSATSEGITLSGQLLDDLNITLSSALLCDGWVCLMLDCLKTEPSPP